MMFARLRHWLESHLRAFSFGVGELLRAPTASFTTFLAIGIAMAFPAGLYALLQNGQGLAQQWNHDPTISLYLKPALQSDETLALTDQLKQRNDIADVRYISPEEGLKELQQQSGLAAALDVLPENPLPGVIVITPRIQSEKNLQNLLASLNQLPNVEASQLDTVWVQRLYELMTLGRRITYSLFFLFGIGVALTVGNTMRLAAQSHRQDILVLRLVGATPAFIRRPMLYRGTLYGAFGGMLAWSLVETLFFWLQTPAQQLTATYQGMWQLQSLSLSGGVAMVAACAVLGWLGARFAIQSYLQMPES